MKYPVAKFGGTLVAIICILAATYLAVHDKAGWGWFLFIGLICAGYVTQ